MRGAWYAAGEIVVFMVLATLVGVAMGVIADQILGRRGRHEGDPEAPAEDVESTRAHIAALERRLEVSRQAIEELEAEREDVEQLRATVARLEESAEAGEELDRLRRLLAERDRRIAELEASATTALTGAVDVPGPHEAVTLRTTAGLGSIASVTIHAVETEERTGLGR